MADISKIKLPDGTEYNIKDATARGYVTGVKGNAESSYRTGNVNLTAANVQAIQINSAGNTQQLIRPNRLNGTNDNTLDAKINTLRANRLAFLPADQIIIEKTTDGGVTWVDAGVADSTKVGLFSETRAGVNLPLLNGVKSLKCGLRITFTAMKYNVPSGTAETAKYNYWNSNYIVSTERYNQLKEMYFWISANSDTVNVKLERATGAASTTWQTAFQEDSWGMTGWSGNDYIRFSQGVFGGGTTQTTNYWNYRLTFMTRGPGGGTTMATTYTTSAQTIMEIRGYGDTWWNAGNEYAANDKIYTHDYLKNVTFPANVTASRFVGPADSIRDAGNGTTITAQYSGSGLSSATWIAAWNGYKIAPINQSNITAGNVSGTVALDHGGTGATSASGARTNLGLGTAAVADLSTSTSSTSTTAAATSSAVKTAYDLANTANGTANSALSGVNGTLIYDHTYTISNGVATFSAHVYQKGSEVTSSYADSCFTWSYRLDSNVTGTPSVVSLGTGKTKTITISTLGYGGHVIGTFTPA